MIVRSRNCDRIITRRTHQVLPNSSGRQCPLYPRKRTLELSCAMSALCQKRTSGPPTIRSPRRCRAISEILTSRVPQPRAWKTPPVNSHVQLLFSHCPKRLLPRRTSSSSHRSAFLDRNDNVILARRHIGAEVP